MNTLIETLNLWGTRFAAFALPMLAQSAVLIALLFGIDVLLRHRVRATVRYVLWMLVLIKLLLPPTLMLPTSLAYWLPQTTVTQTTAGNASLMSNLLPGNNDTAAKPVAALRQKSVGAPLTRPALTAQALMLLVWLAAFAGLAVWVGRQFRSVAQILRHSTEAPANARALLDSCREQLGINRAVRLRYTTSGGSPAICGLFRPVILIPASLPGELSESELRSVLLHELAHFRRGDLWIGHAQIVLQLFYWYNPLLWLANRMIRRVREQAVDEMVLVEMQGDADAYPETLLQVAKLTLARPALSLGLVGILEPAGGLKERIHHILRRPIPTTARIGIRGVMLVTVMALVILPMASKRMEAAASPQTPATARVQQDAALQGMRLTAEQALGLEAKLVKDPEDLTERLQLLGYYQTKEFKPGDARQLRQGHILWLIEHHPDGFVSSPYFVLNKMLDGAAYEQGKTLWLKQVQDHPGNLMILGNAADYLLLFDRAGAEDLLKQAEAAEPNNSHWPEILGQLYALNAQNGGPAAAAKAVAELEKAQAEKPSDSIENLASLAKMSFAAGDMEKAATYATKVLQEAADNAKAWNYDTAVHQGNVILGRVAVHNGNLEEAKKYLLKSGKISGSPVLETFGPNMSLAKDLLEKGEKDTVLAYFQLCSQFWTTSQGPDKLKEWTKEIMDGKTPDFGANLFY